MAFVKIKNYIITTIFAFFILLCFSGLSVNAEEEPAVVPYNIEIEISDGAGETGGSVKVWKDSSDFQICSSSQTTVTVLNDVINFDILPDNGYEIESVIYAVGVDYRTMSSSNVNGVARYTLDNTNKETKSGILKVTFSPVYTISVSDDDDTNVGKISISGADKDGILKVKAGETSAKVQYTVTAPTGYQIDNITIGTETTNYSGNTETVTDDFIAISDTVISAEFSKKEFNLYFGYKSGQETIGTTKLIHNGMEYNTDASPILVEYGDEIKLNTIITDSNTLYAFYQYNCDDGSFEDKNEAKTVYTVGDSDFADIFIETEFVNEYIKISFDVRKNGSISYSGNSGNVTVNSDDKTSYRAAKDFKFKVTPASSLYTIGSVVYIPDATGIAETVKANGGYYVISKSLGSGTLRATFVDASSYEVVVEEPSGKNCYMTVKADGVKLSPGVNRVSADATITISAYTDEGSGYEFDYISINGTAKTASESYKISYLTEDIKIAAVFEKVETYKITINNKTGGTIEQTGGLWLDKGKNVQVNKGDYVEFRIIPDDDYKLENISYTGSDLENIGLYRYRTGIVTTNEKLDVTFVAATDNIISVDVDSSGVTVVSVKSAEDIPDLVSKYNSCIFRTPMSVSGVIDTDALAAIKGKNIGIKFDGSDYYWTIYGKNIDDATQNINLGVTTGEDIIAERLLVPLSKFEDKKQFRIAHDGKFPFRADLHINVGKEHVGRYANLFILNENTYKLEHIACATVDKQGYATYGMKHASDYVIVISDRKLSNSDLSSSAGIESKEIQLIGFDDLGSLSSAAILLVGVLVVGAVIAFILLKPTKNKR
ncbi:MAG: hypothetical protein IKK32_01945 [Oscillospiraceae bacterium]|nr:hypothetical protein [Oscillospiraceae bacterium]